MKRLGWDGATIEQRTFSSEIKDSTAAADDRQRGDGPTNPCPTTHTPSKATDTPMYTHSSLVKDGGTTVLTVLLSPTVVPVATSTVAAAAQTKPNAMLTIPFVKLNTLLN